MGYNQADAPAATAWSKKILANFNPNDPLSEIMDMPSEFIEQARTMVIRYRKQIAQKLKLIMNQFPNSWNNFRNLLV